MASVAIHRHGPRGGAFFRWSLPPSEGCIGHCPAARSPFKASVTLAPHSRRCCTRQGRNCWCPMSAPPRQRAWPSQLAAPSLVPPTFSRPRRTYSLPVRWAVIDQVAAGKLRAKVVCGAANNQLAATADGDRLAERDILYAPDYVVNAGGIINVAAEYLGWPQADSNARVEATADRLADVFTHAETHGVAPHTAADHLARQRIANASLDAPDELAVAA